MRVTINVTMDHRGNPRGAGEATATIVFIDRKGSRHEKQETAAVENDTKNALALRITVAALKDLIKPCEVDLNLHNPYVKSCIENGWLEGWKKRGWKKAARVPPANEDLWKGLYVLLQIHKVRIK